MQRNQIKIARAAVYEFVVKDQLTALTEVYYWNRIRKGRKKTHIRE